MLAVNAYSDDGESQAETCWQYECVKEGLVQSSSIQRWSFISRQKILCARALEYFKLVVTLFSCQ
jgi:hypothetical protein